MTPVLNAIAVTRGEIEIVRAEVIEDQNIDNLTNGLLSNQVIPLLKDIQDCACPPESELFATFSRLQGYTATTTVQLLTFAQVNVVEGTDKAKTYPFPGTQDVALVGWYAFGRNGRLCDRKPLQFANNLCVPPAPGMNEFAFGLYNGLIASGTVHREKAKT